MHKILEWITKILSYLLILLMSAIVLDVFWQVFTRFVLKDPSSFTEELAGFLLIWIGVLGASYALRTKSHLGIDILTYKFTGLKRAVIDITVYTLVFAFALFVMVIGGNHLVKMTLVLQQISPAMHIKMGYVYTVLPISGILIMLFCVDFIVQAIKNHSNKEILHHISKLD